MTDSRQPTLPRRVLLGISAGNGLATSVEAAAMFAAGLGAALTCLVIEGDDLMAIAGLPFARTVGHGGMSAPMTPEGVTGYFRHLERLVARELADRCQRFGIRWSLTRPQGDYAGELLALAEAGDVIVVGLGDVHGGREALDAMLRLFLGKALAVVLPALEPPRRGKVIALSEDGGSGEVAALAHAVAAAAGLPFEIMPPKDYHPASTGAAVVVLALALAERLGGIAAVRSLVDGRSAIVLVPDGS